MASLYSLSMDYFSYTDAPCVLLSGGTEPSDTPVFGTSQGFTPLLHLGPFRSLAGGGGVTRFLLLASSGA